MSKKKRAVISVIIRTKNEEKWIGRCLESVFSQKVDAEIEVVLVDNDSTDHTVEVAKRYPVNKFINISDFLPGKALNDGIRASIGDFIVCISAHCIPEKDSWIEKLLVNFERDEKIAGVYGRQLPLSFTDSVDKRDLLIVFGLDKRIQKKDYFFHNANSMIPRSVWEKFPFDEKVANIEDRVWGKKVVDAGYNIIYEPDAAVFHHHGLHQGNARPRVRGVVSIMEHVDAQEMNNFPIVMSPGKTNVAAVVPIIGELAEGSEQKILFEKTFNDLKSSNFVSSIYCLSEKKSLTSSLKIKWLDRNQVDKVDSISLNELMKHALEMIEADGDFPESILYVNYDYVNRPEGIFDELVSDAQYNGFDTIFPSLVDYGHYWYHSENEEYKQIDPSLKPREKRDPIYKALYGLGCLTSSWIVRKGDMVGGKVGILTIEDYKTATRLNK
jgi:rhamnosyltransferase